MRRPSTDNTSGTSVFFDMMINSHMSKVECCENYSMGGCSVNANLHDVVNCVGWIAFRVPFLSKEYARRTDKTGGLG